MDWITDDILIGNYLDAKNVAALTSEGVRSILCLDGSLAGVNYTDHGISEIKVIELIDGAGNRPEVYLRAVNALKRFRRNYPPTLVHCHAGQSRSAVVVASHFMRDRGLSLADAMNTISSKREVIITAGLQEVLDFHESGGA